LILSCLAVAEPSAFLKVVSRFFKRRRRGIFVENHRKK
jgi:hypothetical protein